MADHRVYRKSLDSSDDWMHSPRTRLLRSQLRRHKLLEQIQVERKLTSKNERKLTDNDGSDEKESPLPPPVQPPPPPYVHLPPIHHGTALPEPGRRNTKSDLMDMMMMQSCQMHQMISQKMAMSFVNPPSPPPSSSSTSSYSRSQRDKVLLAMMMELLKSKSSPRYDSGTDRSMYHPIYIPVIQRQPDYSNRSRQVEERRSVSPVSMTSRWRPRARETKEPARVAMTSNRFMNPQLWRQALKKFRLAGYAAIFTRILYNRQGRRLMYVLRHPAIEDDLLTGIRIKECVKLLNTIYLSPEKKMFRILRQVYDVDLDLSGVLTDKGTKDQRHRTIELLASFIENISYEMAFTPTPTGSLGTAKKTNLYHLLQPQQAFPEHYFWPMERSVLPLDAYSRTPEKMSSDDEFIVFIGLCLGRGLISTILRYPHEFGLTNSPKTEALSTKVRLIITLFVYLLRKLYASPNSTPVPVALPQALSRKLFSDETMSKIYKELRSSFEYAEKVLRDWGQTYLKQLYKN